MNLEQWKEDSGMDIDPDEDGYLYRPTSIEYALWIPHVEDDIEDEIESGEATIHAEGDQWRNAWVEICIRLNDDNEVVCCETYWDHNYDVWDRDEAFPWSELEEKSEALHKEHVHKTNCYYRYVLKKGIDPLREFFARPQIDQKLYMQLAIEREGEDGVRVSVNPETKDSLRYAGIESNGDIAMCQAASSTAYPMSWVEVCKFHSLDPSQPRHEFIDDTMIKVENRKYAEELREAAKRCLGNN